MKADRGSACATDLQRYVHEWMKVYDRLTIFNWNDSNLMSLETISGLLEKKAVKLFGASQFSDIENFKRHIPAYLI